jgi:hypothetical protein
MDRTDVKLLQIVELSANLVNATSAFFIILATNHIVEVVL